MEAAPGLFCAPVARDSAGGGKQIKSDVVMSVSNNELGELLIDLGLVTHGQLADAISLQQASGIRLTVVLAQMGLVSERQLKDALELQYGVNFVNLGNSAADYSEFVRLVPEEIERKYRFVPVSKTGNQYTVAMVDPDDLIAADAVRVHLQSGNFKKLVCTAEDFEFLMHFVYERVEAETELEQPGEETAAGVAETDSSLSASERTSKTKLKSHMRNLFGADSDDDLDEMFGGQSSDNIDALKETDQEPLAEKTHAEEEVEGELSSLKEKKGTRSITSLFGDDEDDDFGKMDEEPAPAAPAAKKKKSGGKSKSASEEDEIEKPQAAPDNLLLEHILEEAKTTKPAPKRKSKKKSMQSLFDDDDDMNFGEDAALEAPVEEETAAPEPENHAREVDAEPENEPEDIQSITASGSHAMPGRSFKSLFGDDDDDDMEMDMDMGGEPALDDQDAESVAAPEVEEGTEPVEDEDSKSERKDDQSEPEALSPAADEEGPEPESALMSARPLRSLFDDDMDEDDLFNDAETAISGSLTGDDSVAGTAPEVVAEPEAETGPEPGEEFETRAGETEPAEEMETAESLLSAINRPFQSLFDDEDDDADDEMFGASETADEQASASEVERQAEEPSEPEPREDEPAAAEPESEPDPEADLSAGERPEPQEESKPDFEDVPLAYSSSFDDEMDEDGLFASASHPIPEGAPQLRDLLSRFDDSSDTFSTEPADSSGVHEALPTAAEHSEGEGKKEAGLAVSALIAALDEQLPDDPDPIEPTLKTRQAGDDFAPLQDSGLHNQLLPDQSEEDEPVAAEDEPVEQKKPVTAPKSKRLRALMSEDDDDAFSEPSAASKSSTANSTMPGSPADDDDGLETIDALIQHLEGGAEPPEVKEEKVGFDEVLPLDREQLLPEYGSATSELPPIVVSHSAKTLDRGSGRDEQAEEVEQPAASLPRPKQAMEPVVEMETPARSGPQAEPSEVEDLQPPGLDRAETPAEHANVFPTDSAYDLPPLPAIDDVLASVTNEIIDNAELANLSGNRTEISFLEEIVESELAFSEQIETDAPAPQPAAAAAAGPASDTPEPVARPEPVATAPVLEEAAPQEVPAPAAAAAPQQQDMTAPPAVAAQLDPSILNLATQILTQAVNSPCSDVHFEPLADGLALRFMSEGELLDETILPAQIQGMLILCLKSMAGLDTAVVDRPQDKKFVTRSFGDPVEMRITSIPGIHGEMVAVSLKN